MQGLGGEPCPREELLRGSSRDEGLVVLQDYSHSMVIADQTHPEPGAGCTPWAGCAPQENTSSDQNSPP